LTSRSVRNLQYVSEKQTQTWIANQTGIPRSTVGFALRGERALPSKYTLNARRIYQTEAYRRMTKEGMSPNQASRFKWFAPEAVGLKTGIMKEIINESTLMRIGQKQVQDQKTGIMKDIDDYWKDTKKEVQESYRRSDSTLDDWINYHAWLFLKV